MSKPETIKIDEVEYVRKDSIPALSKAFDNYVIVRCKEAGVFAGELIEICKAEQWCVLQNSRRLWYWDGAASLSQLAVEGVSKPQNCKFPLPIPRQELFGIIEVIPCTDKAIKSIAEVKIWKS